MSNYNMIGGRKFLIQGLLYTVENLTLIDGCQNRSVRGLESLWPSAADWA